MPSHTHWSSWTKSALISGWMSSLWAGFETGNESLIA